ncbi:hypothetical protein [Flammeovirga kamogawensis]|uniref:Lipoprotein n=1 Tax=Flammeovirga kamogawensis TaxID=373891 RepID=A0ABX8GZ79_9BACT|nr:hypothetical protein [Flammeovirga kamogawensis]MBB6459153.1 hypothetical protein [Flammeovirga kamogawensis]QWG08719.1 hypothetical protein KM029_07210 [Flammeovirga kamogawensis]TRX67012.1 hypothetical protein EO216_02255 [Flammeovirga kamogawensis]
MKNLLILLLASFSLFSCSDKKDPEPIVKEVVKTTKKDNSTDKVEVKKASKKNTSSTSKSSKEKVTVPTPVATPAPVPSSNTSSKKKKHTSSDGKVLFTESSFIITQNDIDKYFKIKKELENLINEHKIISTEFLASSTKSKALNQEVIELKKNNAPISEINTKKAEVLSNHKKTLNIAIKKTNKEAEIRSKRIDLSELVKMFNITE